MSGDGIGAVVIIAIVAVILWFHAPPSNIAGLTPITQDKPRFHLLRESGDGDGTVRIQPGTDNLPRDLVLLDGSLYDKEVAADVSKKLADKGFRVSFTPDYYFIDAERLDLGTWAGVRTASSDIIPRGQVGVRYSPARLGFGLLAPDIVASRDVGGVGLSLFPPPRYCGRVWSHFGLGAWYTFPFRDSSSGPSWCYGLSFSTRP